MGKERKTIILIGTELQELFSYYEFEPIRIDVKYLFPCCEMPIHCGSCRMHTRLLFLKKNNFAFIYLAFGTTPGCVQGFFLILHSGITLVQFGDQKGPRYQMWVSHM